DRPFRRAVALASALFPSGNPAVSRARQAGVAARSLSHRLASAPCSAGPLCLPLFGAGSAVGTLRGGFMKAVARVLLTLILPAAGCAGGYELWDYYMLSPWTRDARVQADVVSIAPDVSGFVDDLRVKDNQFVHKGDILFVLDRERYTRALATA